MTTVSQKEITLWHRAIDRHWDNCKRHGQHYECPTSVSLDGDTVTLHNCSHVIARYRLEMQERWRRLPD